MKILLRWRAVSEADWRSESIELAAVPRVDDLLYVANRAFVAEKVAMLADSPGAAACVFALHLGTPDELEAGWQLRIRGYVDDKEAVTHN